MNPHVKYFGLFVVATNLLYLSWLLFSVQGILGWLFFFAEGAIILLTVLFLVNHWNQHHTLAHPHDPKGSVDVFLPVVDEDIALYEKTIQAATRIDYRKKKLFILDDGNRAELKELAKKYGATYLKNTKRRNFKKAGNLNNGLVHSKGDYILVLDADHIVEPEIIQDLLGYFQDDHRIALVSTKQRFNVPYHDFNHDRLFYDHMQNGKNIDNASVSTGNCVLYRRRALGAIGGFQTWNVVEDLTTTYELHRAGFLTVYINKAYSTGHAPLDLYNIYKQRGTWSLDAYRLFLYKNVLFSKKLDLRQKSHYTELVLAYLVSAVCLPILFLLPAINLYLNQLIVDDPVMYLVLRIPTFIFILVFYFFLGGRTTSVTQYWAGLWPVYLKALFLSLFPVKQKFRVTQKFAGPRRRDISLVIPQISLVAISYLAFFWRLGIQGDVTPFTGINLLWIVIMTFWFFPVIRKGFALE